MQTFHPYVEFQRAVEALDYRRLGKQRVEAFQILCALGDTWATTEYVNKYWKWPGSGWRHHPVTQRWKGYEPALQMYYAFCVSEWMRRGYSNTMLLPPRTKYKLPPWLTEDFAYEHRLLLFRKDPVFYAQFGPLV